MKAQILSSAESILHTFIEGCGASTEKEFARFLQMGIKSSMELEGQLELAHGYEILPERDWRALGTETVDIRRMLCGLRAKVLRSELPESSNDGPTDNAKRETHAARDCDAESQPSASDAWPLDEASEPRQPPT